MSLGTYCTILLRCLKAVLACQREVTVARKTKNSMESSGSFDVWQARKQGEKTNKTKH